MRRAMLAGIMLSAVGTVESASAQSIRDLQERYCTGDAFRLCSSEIPNEDRIEACMTRLRHLLSPDCRAVFDRSESISQEVPAQRGRPRKPLQLVQ